MPGTKQVLTEYLLDERMNINKNAVYFEILVKFTIIILINILIIFTIKPSSMNLVTELSPNYEHKKYDYV